MKESKEEMVKKWSSILGPMGITRSQLDNLSQLTENQPNQDIETSEFPTLLPIAMKVAAKTIANDLIFASKEEIEEVKNRIQSENRDGKIESIIEDKEFVEKKLEDDPEYKELIKKGVTPMSTPTGNLFYIDFKYDGESDSI